MQKFNIVNQNHNVAKHSFVVIEKGRGRVGEGQGRVGSQQFFFYMWQGTALRAG